MNNLQKNLDRWYKEWRGVAHENESNLKVLDSSCAQDYAMYCIDRYKEFKETKQKIEDFVNFQISEGKFAIFISAKRIDVNDDIFHQVANELPYLFKYDANKYYINYDIYESNNKKS